MKAKQFLEKYGHWKNESILAREFIKGCPFIRDP
jgi:hypothetical protein